MNQKGMSLTVIVALIIGATTAGAAAYIVIHHVFFSESPLSPARNLVGTWKTNFPTKYYCATNEDTGTFVDFGSEDRQVTWVITATGNESVVNIDQSFTESNLQGWDPKVVDISPTGYTGIISSSSLTVKDYRDEVVGYFSFTTDIITGTWSDTWAAFNHNVHTAVSGLTLTRQH